RPLLCGRLPLHRGPRARGQRDRLGRLPGHARGPPEARSVREGHAGPARVPARLRRLIDPRPAAVPRGPGMHRFLLAMAISAALARGGCRGSDDPKPAVIPAPSAASAAPAEAPAPFAVVDLLDFGRREVRNFAYCNA